MKRTHPLPFKRWKLTCTAAAAACLSLSTLPAWSQPVKEWFFIDQQPATADLTPAPNVIISVDDTERMANATDVGIVGGTRLDSTKRLLTELFLERNIPSYSVRLAWQNYYSCPDLLRKTGKADDPMQYCVGKNTIDWLADTHRLDFNSWISTLGPFPDNDKKNKWWQIWERLKDAFEPDRAPPPTAQFMQNLHNYYLGNGWDFANDPFAQDPGLYSDPILACRRTFHLVFTDGLTFRGKLDWQVGNADGTEAVMPTNDYPNHPIIRWFNPATGFEQDMWRYDLSPEKERLLYSDDVGKSQSTLADYAFYMWFTDYRPDLKNIVPPVVRIPGTTTLTPPPASGLPTVNIHPYWNSRNNPATWQGVTTYTISVGKDANLRLPPFRPGKKPDWMGPRMDLAGNTVDTYIGGYNGLLFGEELWKSPFFPDPWRPLLMLPGNRRDVERRVEDARRKDIWHAAMNSRGLYLHHDNDFYPEDSSVIPTLLSEVFRPIFSDTPITSAWSANAANVKDSTVVFKTEYKPATWSGNVKGYTSDAGGVLAQAPLWDAAALLDAADWTKRRIYTQKNSATDWQASYPPGGNGVVFDFDNVSQYQLDRYFTPAASGMGSIDFCLGFDTTQDFNRAQINYLRGDRSFEKKSVVKARADSRCTEPTIPGVFRDRDSRLASIVSSQPWYVAKPNMGYSDPDYQAFRTAQANRLPMVYIGASSGMLHGFAMNTASANNTLGLTDGAEKFAYLPQGALWKGLATQTLPSWQHQYGVGGKPFTGDFKVNGQWRTALVSSLGAGGRGFFVLDVTNPVDIASASYSPKDLIIADLTGLTPTPTAAVGALSPATFRDIGTMLSPPTVDSANPERAVQITKLNNGRWAVLMGNGINSEDAQATLLFQFLDGAKEFVTLKTPTPPSGATMINGMANPQVIDLNGDGTADIVYAGDAIGNMWKFDLTSSNPSDWKVALGGQPVFYGGGARGFQTAPTWVWNEVTNASTGKVTRGINLVLGAGRDPTLENTRRTSGPLGKLVSENRFNIVSVWDNTHVDVSLINGKSKVTLVGGTGNLEINASWINKPGPLVKVELGDLANPTQRNQVGSSTKSVNYSCVGGTCERGWFASLPEFRETVLANGQVLNRRLVSIPSTIPIVPKTWSNGQPRAESCDPQTENLTKNYMNIFDAVSGQPYSGSVIDTNEDGLFDSGDTQRVNRVALGDAPPLALGTRSTDPKSITATTIGIPGRQQTKFSWGVSPARIGWRQLQ